jgi:hypothetical protein
LVKEELMEEDEFNQDEELIEISDDDFAGLDAFGADPTWTVPLIRRTPNPKYYAGSKEKPVLAYVYRVPVKMLTQVEIMRMSEGKRVPKGSRNIIDDLMIKRYSKSQADMLNIAIKRAGGKLKITMDGRGQANYAAGELSINDLSTEDVKKLEVAISPGVSKSQADYEGEFRATGSETGPAPSKSKPVHSSKSNLGKDARNPESVL